MTFHQGCSFGKVLLNLSNRFAEEQLGVKAMESKQETGHSRFIL